MNLRVKYNIGKERQHEIRSCPKFEDCLTKAAIQNRIAVPCRYCKEKPIVL